MAFALPILHQVLTVSPIQIILYLIQLSVDPYGVYALVLTPTRELAFQIGDQFQVSVASDFN